MNIGIAGPLGSGKSLAGSAVAVELHRQTGIPLLANYKLDGARIIKSARELLSAEYAIVVIDEVHKTLDCRNWKAEDIKRLTYWILETRHRGVLFFWISQHPSQVEVRLRTNTDYMLVCNKNIHTGAISVQVMDWLYKNLTKTYSIDDPSKYYKIYDSYGIIHALE